MGRNAIAFLNMNQQDNRDRSLFNTYSPVLITFFELLSHLISFLLLENLELDNQILDIFQESLYDCRPAEC